MSLFSALNLIHGAFVKKDPKYINFLAKNKYYIVPIVNVDGVQLIDDLYQKEHKFLSKRKNSNPKAIKNEKNLEECGIENSGVDLNRNYGEFW